MALNFFQRRRILKNLNYLDLIPITKIKHELNNNGNIDLVIPKFKNEGFAKWFIPKRKSLDFVVHLDEIGSAAWLEIDGKQTVKQICNNLTEKFGDKAMSIEERIAKFYTKLYDQRYISFTVLEQ